MKVTPNPRKNPRLSQAAFVLIRHLLPVVALIILLAPRLAHATTYSWITTNLSGNWSATGDWSPTATTGGPGSGDTANISGFTNGAQITYDAGASGTVGAITLEQANTTTNTLLLNSPLSFTNFNIYPDQSGTAAATDNVSVNLGASQSLIDGPGDTITAGNPGNATQANDIIITGTGSGTVQITGGLLEGFVANNNGGNGVVYTINAPVSMTSGEISLVTDGTYGKTGNRFAFDDNVLISGGTLNLSGSNNATDGTLYFAGASTEIDSAVALTGSFVSTTEGNIIVASSNVTQTFNMGLYQAGFTLRNTNVGAGTSTTKIVTSLAGNNLIGGILLQNGVNSTGTNVLTFQLGGNLTVASGEQLVGFNVGTPTGAANVSQITAIDLNGYTYDGTDLNQVASQFTATTNSNALIEINSSVPGGVFKAGYYSLSTTNLGVGSGVTLQAITAGQTNNLGVLTDTNAAGVNFTQAISPGSTFLYTGAGSANLTSNRTIGMLTVGDGNEAATLTLTSAITTGSSVTINNGGTLVIAGANTLTTPNSGDVTIASGGSLNSDFTNLTQSLLNQISSNSGTGGMAYVNLTVSGTLNSTTLNFSSIPNVSLGSPSGQEIEGSPGEIIPGNGVYQLGSPAGELEIQGALLTSTNSVQINGNVEFVTNTGNWTGSTTIASGTLFQTSARLPSADPLTVNSGGALSFLNYAVSGGSQTIASLSGAGFILNSNTGTHTLIVNGTSSATFSGSINDGAPASGTPGSLALTKSGSGTQYLSGVNNYSGATLVNGGVLIVSGSLTGTASVTANSGDRVTVDGLVNTSALVSTNNGFIGGQGTVGAVNISGTGTLSPGATVENTKAGSLTANGNVTLNSTSFFSIRLGQTTAGDHDQLILSTANTVTLNGGTLPTLQLTLGPNYAMQPVGTLYEIINGDASTLTAGTAIIGQFSNGSSITAGGATFNIVYDVNSTDTGTGNDVLLVVVPEPETWSMLAGGLGLLTCARCVRRRMKPAIE